MRKRSIVLALGAVLALLVGMQVAFASHPEASLAGSNFEIDTDANLTQDDPSPSLDWASVTEIRQPDDPTGPDDRSFGQGTKESTLAPTIVDGGIPPNKSDLKFFGLYQEGDAATGFLNLFWSRVRDPSGTTNMDFELNQRQCTPGLTPVDPDCTSNGLTPKRSTGDLLITYDLSQGGTVATISYRRWRATDVWGASQPLDTDAVGTINTNTILAGDSDGLGAQDPRTFGEAQIKLSALFPNPNTCQSFGSAYLKSRSSDSFTAALKDFVPPTPVNITNCGSVEITKTDDANPANPLAGAEFKLYNDNAPTGTSRGAEDTLTNPLLSCTTPASGICTINNVPFGQYWIVETTTPAGYDTAADQHASVSAATPTVKLTFVDVRQLGAIQVTKTAKHKGTDTSTRNLAATFTVKQGSDTIGTITTNGTSGIGCMGNLPLGSYTVTETSGPSEYQKDPDTETASVSKGTCASGAANVTFENVPLTDITVSAQSQVGSSTAATSDDATASKISCTNQTATPPDGTPNDFDDTSETVVDLAPGTYTCTVVVDP